jgi:hypothetical protein
MKIFSDKLTCSSQISIPSIISTSLRISKKHTPFGTYGRELGEASKQNLSAAT